MSLPLETGLRLGQPTREEAHTRFFAGVVFILVGQSECILGALKLTIHQILLCGSLLVARVVILR